MNRRLVFGLRIFCEKKLIKSLFNSKSTIGFWTWSFKKNILIKYYYLIIFLENLTKYESMIGFWT